MSIIIRLQNLPWAATCMDIRRYFWGLSIPEGGVHIVGGEMGDAFIGFSTDEDARQAMSRDGGKIHEMQIRLLLSSHAEMMRVIEKARQQNMALQSQVMPPAAPAPQPQVMPVTHPMQAQIMPVTQPSQMMTQPSQMMTQPSQMMTQPSQMMTQQPMPQPSQMMTQQPMPQQMAPQDNGDQRNRRARSPSPARRPRDRSPARSSSDRSRRSSSKRDRSRSPPRGSRASSSDYRRGDRKRDDRGYDDRSYRDDRYRKYPERDRRYYDHNQASNSPSYGSYDRSKSSSNSYSSSNNNDKGSAPSQQPSFPASSNNYSGSSGGNSSYDHSAMTSNSSKPAAEEFPKRRRSRFDPDPPTTSSDIPFFDAEQKNKLAEALRALPNLPLVTGKPTGQEYSSSTNTPWPQQTSNQESNPQSIWPKLEKRHPNQGVVPMDLESSPTSSPPDTSSKIIVNQPFNSQRDSHSFMHGSNDMPSRNHPSVPDQKDRFMNKPQQQQQPQWSAPNPSSLTVEVRGPPPDVKVNELLDLFHAAPLAPANIFILKNQRGEAEKALVQFQKLSDAQMALSRQPCYIRNYCVEVVSCPDALFKAAIANATSQMKPAFKPRPQEEDWCVQMSGFTFPCTEPDIGRILGGIRIVDLAIDDEKGCAFVQLSSDQDFRCALSMTGKMFGQGCITISVSSKEFLNAARGSSDQRRGQNNFGGPPHSGRRPFNENPNGPVHENGPPAPAPHNRPQNYAVHLRQLPQHVTDKAINEFFKETGVVVKAIHILLTPEKVPSGEGFIEMATKEEVDIALTRHNTMFLGRPIQVSPIPFHEMNLILNPPGLLPLPEEELARRGPERPFNKPEFEAPPNGRPPRKEFFDGPGHPPPRGERPFFPSDRPRPDFRGERPFFPRQRGERPRMDGPPMRGPRPPMRPPFGRMRGPFPQRPRGPPWDPSRAREQGEIGAPGCVVNIDNLHFDAGFEEILEFFKGYGILRDNIIRKYDERKQPTSKARVAFHTPWDAERAVRELNHEKIKGRPLNLSIL